MGTPLSRMLRPSTRHPDGGCRLSQFRCRALERDFDLAWEMGCRHPDIAEALAGLVAAPGRLADFEDATAIWNEALEERHGLTSDSWLGLLSRRNQVAGRAQRLVLRPSG
jgi:hypothetical protein